MRLRIPGWLGWTAGALVAIVVVVVALVHTPPVARRALDWLIAQASTRFQIDLQAAGMRINLLTRRVTLEDVRLAAQGHADEPFFSASRVSVTVPLSIVGGDVRLSSLEVDGARVLLRRADGEMVNLPPSSGGPPPATARELGIGELLLRDLSVDYLDRTADVEVTLTGLDAALDGGGPLAGASGPITADRLRVRVDERTTTSEAIAGRMAFDGSTVTLESFTVPLPEARLVVDGRVDRVLDATVFALRLSGAIHLAPIVEWVSSPVPVSGSGTLDGTYEGPLGEATLRARFSVPDTRLGQARPLPLTGNVVLTSDRLAIEPFTLTVPATPAAPRTGEVAGRFAYEIDDDGGTSVEATFRDLDLDVALAAYEREPLTVAAWLDGRATLGTRTSDAPLQLRASGTSRPLRRADRIALDGSWEAVLQNEQWNVTHDHRLLSAARAFGTVAWPAADDPAQSPLTGPLTVEVADVGEVVAAARQSGIDLSPWMTEIDGPAHGDLAMDGTLERIVVRGRVTAPDLSLDGAPIAAAADIVYDEDALAATSFEVSTNGGRLAGHVTMGMESSRLSGAFDGAVTDLAAIAAPAADLTGLTGELRVSGTLGGTTDAPDVPFSAESSGLAYDGVTVSGATARGRLLGTEFRVDELRLEQADGGLNATAQYDYESGAYQAELQVNRFLWDHPVEGAPIDVVRVDGRFAGQGTVEQPGGSGHFTVTPSGGTYGNLVGPTELDGQFSGGRFNLTAFVPSLRTFAQASVSPSAPYGFRGTAVVNALDIQTVALTLGSLPNAVSGTVRLSAAFEGELANPQDAEAFVNLQDVALSVGGMPVRLDAPARIAVRSDDVTVEDLTITAGQSRLEVSGRLKDDPLASPLQASFDGNLADVVALGRAFVETPDIEAAGRLTGTWESRGSLGSADATLVLEGARVAAEEYPAVESLDARATFDGRVLDVQSLSGRWAGATFTGTARLPRTLLDGQAGGQTAGRLDLRVQGLGPRALAPWVAAETIAGLDGRVSATLGLDVASLEPSGLTGTLVLDEATITAAGVPITQEHPARISIANSRVTFDDVAFSAGTPVVIGGSVSLGDEIGLDLTLTGTPGLRPFSVLSPGIAVDGIATVDLRVGGTAAAPRVEGRVDLDSGEVVMRDPRVIASDITGPILFEGDRISIPGLSGTVNGGDLDASGSVTLDGLTPTGGQLTVQAQGMAVEYPEDVDTEVDALLTIVPAPTPIIRGDVRVLRGAYRATISLPALVAFNATRSTPAAPAGQASTLDALRLDVNVSTEDDLVIDNNYGRFAAGVDVRLQGTAARPAVTGQVTLREGGEVYLLNSQYRLNASTISFTNPNAIEPDMNISLVTRTNGAEQTLTLTGTLDRLETSVTSDSLDGNTSVAGFLLGSGPLDENRALELLSGELLGVTGRAIGLDSLRLERGFESDDIRQDPTLVADVGTDPATRLTLSKQVNQDVEVVLSQGISGGSLSGYVTYRPIRGVELRVTSLENTERLASIRHDISFGGTPLPSASSPRVQRRVTAVAVTGVEGADEAAVHELLEVEVGDTFDFIRWRDDVDRVRAWYRDRGFLEARIDSSRREEAETVALTYEIAPGPPTALRIEGLRDTNRLRRRIEDLWAGAVFDRFLLEEIRNVVAHELLLQNVIGAQAEAVIESTSPTKVILASAVGGQRVASRRLVFEGNEAVSDDRLQEEVATWALTDWGWLYPPSIANAITTYYDAIGHRAASVTAADPVVVGDEARLVLTIDEGPVTTVEDATVTGPSVPDVDVRPLVTALENTPYRYGDVDEVVRQVRRRYADAGYNDAAVTPTVQVPPGSRSATVQIAVEPGPRQRLADVVVTGTDHTNPGAIVTALDLDLGKPVDYAQWAQARKRVYDTDVFRQVDVRPEVLSDPSPDGTQPVRARVTVTEWPTWRLRYGLQLDDRSESFEGDEDSRRRDVGVIANLQNRNLFGRTWKFGVFGRAARRWYTGNSYLSIPTFFGKPLQTNLFSQTLLADIFPDEDGNPLIRRHRTNVSLEQRLRRGRSLQIVYGYRVTREVQDGIASPDDPFYLTVLTGRFTGSMFVDRRDDPFNAHQGWFGAVTAERVSEFESGSDAIKVRGTAYHYRTLGRATFASAARVGLSFLDSLQAIVDPFYLGGADTVRGYGESRIGPKNFVGTATGGDAMLLLNQEVRAPVYSWIHGVAFVDAGNVFDDNTAIRLSKLEVGYGVGLRLNTPFSTFRVDVGWPGTGSGKARWYFGLGQVF